jgi:ABC-type transport system involved in multi-copper enzyme maturation permease subunit
MFTLSRKSEKVLAVGLSVFLLVSIVGVVACIFALGSNWLRAGTPVLRWDIVLFSNAVLLFAIGWTDFPEQARRSIAVRRQVQCLTIWQALLGLLVLVTMEQASYAVLFGLFGPAFALMCYSGGLAYRALRD